MRSGKQPASAMSLKRFRECLARLMPNPKARPFTCDGSPLECRLFIVGLNSATQLDQDFFACYWDDDRGFLRDVFEANYQGKRKKTGTRPRIEAFVKGAFPVPCLETNIYAAPPTKKASQLRQEDKNTAIIEYLLKTIRPAGIFVYTNEPIAFFQELSGCKHIAGDEPTLVKIFGQPTQLLAAPGPLWKRSIDYAKTAGYLLAKTLPWASVKANDIDNNLEHICEGRRMCFEQGKAFVYMPSPDSEFIITEEPNGVVRKLRLSDRTIIRTWPDGSVDHFREGDLKDLKPSYIPPRA